MTDNSNIVRREPNRPQICQGAHHGPHSIAVCHPKIAEVHLPPSVCRQPNQPPKVASICRSPIPKPETVVYVHERRSQQAR